LAEHALSTEAIRPGITDEAIRALSARLGEPAELTQRRLAAAEQYRDQDPPDRVRHLWRYTDPTGLVPVEDINPAEPVAAAQPPQLPDGGGSIVAQPGGVPSVWLSPEAQRAGVAVTSLSRGGAQRDLLGTAVPANHGVFEALNLAAWSAGLLIRVPARTVLRGPLHVRIPANATTNAPRLLVVVGEGAEVALVEEHMGGRTGSRVLAVSEIFVEADAQLRHVVHQGWEAGVHGLLTHRTVLGRDARALTVVSSLGGKLQKADVGTLLGGEGAHSEIVGMALGEKRQHLDLHTEHQHHAGRTTSDMDIRVALGGKAHSAYTGLIRIESDAEDCEAFQRNRNLLLSNKARAETIPELEILNKEVTCSHGATASPVDEAQLFYLQSRGIDRDEAARLVVRGFFEPVLDRIPSPLRERVADAVDRRIARLKGVTR